LTAKCPRAVFDAMVYLQALASPDGTSGKCVRLVSEGAVELWVSQPILLEIGDIITRPAIRSRFPWVTDVDALDLSYRIRAAAGIADPVPPHAMHLPRDPDDEPYLNLAVAVQADYLVTWNERHLSYLMRGDTPEGKQFCSRFPHLQIVDPVTFLRAVEAAQAPPSE
jgi:uncharacterized protein